MTLDCYGVTTEKMAICIFLLIEYDDSVVLVIRTAVFLSIIFETEWDISRLDASVIYPTGDTTPAVCHSDVFSTNLIVFYAIGGSAMPS